eukprot:3414213-Amphidinium_carterae.1
MPAIVRLGAVNAHEHCAITSAFHYQVCAVNASQFAHQLPGSDLASFTKPEAMYSCFQHALLVSPPQIHKYVTIHVDCRSHALDKDDFTNNSPNQARNRMNKPANALPPIQESIAAMLHKVPKATDIPC